MKNSRKSLTFVLALVAVAVFIDPAVAEQERPEQRGGALRIIPPSAELIERIAGLAGGPNPAAIDHATNEAGVPAVLLNYQLATQVHLPVGRAIYIPRQIADREGGRKSLWTLKPGEETVAGIFVTGDGIALRYVKRETGKTDQAADGDIYLDRITTQDGRQVLSLLRGTFRSVDPKLGKGELRDLQVVQAAPGWQAYRRWRVWVVWSFILIEKS